MTKKISKHNKNLFFVPLSFDDEEKIQKASEKIQKGKAVTGYLLSEEELKKRVEEDSFENGCEFYKFVSKGKVVKKIKLIYNK